MRQVAERYALRQLILCGFVALSLAGCDWLATESRRWTEDVVLDDGTTIVVKRYARYRENNSWAGDAYSAEETNALLEFTGDQSGLPEWRFPLIPLLLYRDAATSEWVIVATTSSCDLWNSLGAPRVMYLPDRPRTLYWEYRLGPSSSAWREVPLSRTSAGKPTNLLFDYRKPLGTGRVTVQFKKERQDRASIVERFQVIQDRSQVSCITTVETKRKWATDDAASHPKSTEE